MLNIGLLLPRSPYYNSLSFEMSAGFKAGLKHAGNNDIRLITDNIGFGTDKQQVYRAAEKMLMDDDTAIIFAFAGMRTTQLLRPLFMSANRLLIVLDSGASLPQEWPVSPNILYLSLNNALGARLAAKRAAHDGFKEGGMVTNYYDGGYLHTLALTEGFTSNGGAIRFNIATGYLREEYKLNALTEHLNKYPESCLLGLASGDFAQWYYEDTKALLGNKLPASYVAPFMLEENLLSRSVFNGGVTKGVASWSKKIVNPLNNFFMESMKSMGREASLFSLLGWEAATISASVTDAMVQNNFQGNLIGEVIKTASYESPRGIIRFNDEWNTSLSPMYEAEVSVADDGKCALNVTGKINDIDADFSQMVSAELGETISGWFNSYTCC